MKTNQHIKRRSNLWEIYPKTSQSQQQQYPKRKYRDSQSESLLESTCNFVQSLGQTKSIGLQLSRNLIMSSRFKATKCSGKNLLGFNHHHRNHSRGNNQTLIARFDEILYKQLILDDSQHHYTIVGPVSKEHDFSKNGEPEGLYDEQEQEEMQLLDTELLQNWSHSLPGGAEKFTCALISIFLLLFLIAVQLYIHMASLFHAEGQSLLCQMLESNNRQVSTVTTPAPFSTPSTPSTALSTEVVGDDETSYSPTRRTANNTQIGFECHFKLLLVAWVCSILAAGAIILVHFVYWNYRYQKLKDQQLQLQLCQQQQQSYRQQAPPPTPLPTMDQFRQEDVIDTLGDQRQSLKQMTIGHFL